MTIETAPRLKEYQMYINGEWVESESGERFESYNPATGEAWSLVPRGNAADVDRAVNAAQAAFESPTWRDMTQTRRGQLLHRLGDLIAERVEHLASHETMDNGKLIREMRGQLRYIPEFYHYYGGLADKIHGDTLPIDKPDLFVYTVREPVGVVAAITPWNSPLYLTTLKLAPALAVGCTMVIKPSEHSSASLLELMPLFEEAGFPPGVVNVVTGFGLGAGDALTSHPLVRHVAFTGGPEAAKHVVRSTAENLAAMTLELGGKSPNMVFDDADPDSAAMGIIAGIFGAAGQSCVAGSRVFLQEGIADAVLQRLVDRARRIRVGNPLEDETEMGPLALAAQLDRVEKYVELGKQEGAQVAFGGERPTNLGKGWYYQPTIFDGVDNRMRIAQEEIFGPVVSVIRFKDEQEAIALANDSQYGLAAGIWTRDTARAHRVARQIRAGVIWVNTYRSISPIAPYGGFKMSGYGRESGAEAINEYTATKTVWINTSSEPMGDPFVMR